jgi:tight adherence protein B
MLNQAQALYYLFAVLLFIAVVLAIEGAYLWWNDSRGPEAKRIERRLNVMSAGAHGETREATILKQRLLSQTPGLQRLLLAVPRIHRVDRFLEQSGVSWSVAQFLLLIVALAAGSLTVMRVLDEPWLVTLPVVVLVALSPIAFVTRAKRLRLRQIDLQLPDALDLMGRALRAGHAFPSALKMVGEEMADPVAREFGIAFDEINYGISMQDALMNLATRVPSTDLKYFVVAVLIQRETGGTLAELLDKIAAMIRARHKLLGTIRVLSAEGRLSAWILCLLPFVLAFAIFLINPKFVEMLWTDPAGVRVIVTAAVLMVLGILWMRQIIHFHI